MPGGGQSGEGECLGRTRIHIPVIAGRRGDIAAKRKEKSNGSGGRWRG